MIGLTDRIMKYYIDRELNVEPIILDRHPAPQEGHQYMMYAHIPFCHTHISPFYLQRVQSSRVLRESAQRNADGS